MKGAQKDTRAIYATKSGKKAESYAGFLDQAVNILTIANMEADGMPRTRARRQAFESLNEVPLGRLSGILKRILAGDKEVIEAYRRCSDATRFGHREDQQ